MVLQAQFLACGDKLRKQGSLRFVLLDPNHSLVPTMNCVSVQTVVLASARAHSRYA